MSPGRVAYLLDLPVVAELTRPLGNRRVFTLFQQRQSRCAMAAPVLAALVEGVEQLPEGPRRQQLRAFVQELLRGGPEVVAYDREAALAQARQAARWQRLARPPGRLAQAQAALALARDWIWVTRLPQPIANTEGLRCEDWFRP